MQTTRFRKNKYPNKSEEGGAIKKEVGVDQKNWVAFKRVASKKKRDGGHLISRVYIVGCDEKQDLVRIDWKGFQKEVWYVKI